MRLSIIIPAFNESATISKLIDRLTISGCGKHQWIFVDDGSSDGTAEILKQLAPSHAQVLFKQQNQGKTAAIRSALEIATGDWVIIQDADLEYDPADIALLLNEISESDVSPLAVYGRRPSCWLKPSRWPFTLGVLLIDIAILVVYGRWVRDHATCYKLLPCQTLKSFELEANGFEGCVEITSKLMKSRIPIRQVPISYSPRKASDGKKLKASYGITALKAVWDYRNWRGGTDQASP